MSSEKKTILVTGATGLVGMAVQEEVQKDKQPNEDWIFIASADGNLMDEDVALKIFQKYKPTHVLNLAATVGGLWANMKRPMTMCRNNMKMNMNVMHAASETGTKRVVSCMSTCIFPDKTTYPIDETMVNNGPPHESNFGYAYAKRMIDVLCRAYNKEKGTKFGTVIPTNVFGAHDNFNLEDSHVLPALIAKAYVAKQKGEALQVWGSGKPRRQFIYNRDLARLMIWILRDVEDTDPIICSVDENDEVSIGELSEMVRKAMGIDKPLTYLTDKPDGQFKKTASNAKLRKLNPSFQFTPMEQAVKETCEWYVKNYDTCKR